MRRIFHAAALTALALAFGACAQQATRPMADPAAGAAHDHATAIATAKAERQKAAAVGGEWRDTGGILQAAEQAAAAGDYARARQLAEQAAEQYRLGQEQAASQINVGNPAYLY